MAKRMFRVTVEIDIAIDDVVFEHVLTDEWRDGWRTYTLRTPTDVAKHIAFRIAKGKSLFFVPGFTGLPADAAIVSNIDTTTAVELQKGARHE